MNLFVWSRNFFIKFVVAIQMTISLNGFAATANSSDTEDYFDFLARVNRYSPLEHAGSHGTLGFGLGLGVAGYEAPQNSELRKHYWRSESQLPSDNSQESDRVFVNRLHLHKGLPFSVDVGGALGQDSASKAQIASGYAQWTMYESFAMPAFALRGSFSRILNLVNTEASSVGIEGLASYGFLRIFTVYGSAGVGMHSVSIDTAPSQGTTFVLAQDGLVTMQRQFSQRSQSIGLQVQLVSQFCTLATEASTSSSGSRTYLAKVSVGM